VIVHIQERARTSIDAERDYLMDTCDDPETIRTAVADLEQAARWHGIEIDTAPLLDRADDLTPNAQIAVDWPEGLAEPEESSSEKPVVDLSQTFSRLRTEA
jgi:hypothetical protein